MYADKKYLYGHFKISSVRHAQDLQLPFINGFFMADFQLSTGALRMTFHVAFCDSSIISALYMASIQQNTFSTSGSAYSSIPASMHSWMHYLGFELQTSNGQTQVVIIILRLADRRVAPTASTARPS